jgi:hypothetical protein
MWDSVDDLGAGIYVYHNVLPTDLNLINRLEKSLESGKYSWQPAYVGYQELMPEYRDCVDFKYKKKDLYDDKSEEYLELCKIWDDCFNLQDNALKDYCIKHSIHELKYWEAFNFIKYNKGQHFQYHHDHGFSYNCTVSMVAYLNDDYEGGGLHFSKQDILYTPKAGDLVIFPSNYMYPHRAMPVESGTKYSLVTMLDYSDKFHNAKFFTESGS